MTVLLLIKMGVLEEHSCDCSKGTSVCVRVYKYLYIYIYAHIHTKPESGLQHSSVLAAWIMFSKSAVGTHFKFNASVLAVTAWDHSRTNLAPSPASPSLSLHNAAQQSQAGMLPYRGSPSKDIPLLSPKRAPNKTFSYCWESETSRMKLNYCLIIDNTSEFRPNFFFYTTELSFLENRKKKQN